MVFPSEQLDVREVEVELDGNPRLFLMPGEVDLHPDEAIPGDAYEALRELYSDVPDRFFNRLWLAFWERGLRKPSDFFHRRSSQLVQQSLKIVLRYDILSIQAKLKEQVHD